MQVAGRDVITISRIKRTTDAKIALATGKLLKHGPFLLCNLETKLLLPDKVNLSRLSTTIGYDTGVLTINRQTIRVHSKDKFWCISVD